MSIIHHEAFIQTNFATLIEALIKNTFQMHFVEGAFCNHYI